MLVTGGGGKTGKIVLRKMVSTPGVWGRVIGTARTEEKAIALRKETGAEIWVCDVTDGAAVDACLSGIDTLIILSASYPQPDKLGMLGFLVKRYCCCDKTAKPKFRFPPGAMPEQVDWEGVKTQIDAAKRNFVKHVILVGSMGGTKIDHFLNSMGDGNVLLWKRKSEMYLRDSGLNHTIIHPGGLLPHPGGMGRAVGGERRLLVAVDDELLESKTRTVPREDLAEVCLQCALHPEACSDRAFDLASCEPEEGGRGAWDRNLASLLSELKGRTCSYKEPKHAILENL